MGRIDGVRVISEQTVNFKKSDASERRPCLVASRRVHDQRIS